MARSERSVAEQFRADGAEHTDRVFRSRCGHSDAVASSLYILAEAHDLMTDADVMLAKGAKALIEEYYRAANKGL